MFLLLTILALGTLSNAEGVGSDCDSSTAQHFVDLGEKLTLEFNFLASEYGRNRGKLKESEVGWVRKKWRGFGELRNKFVAQCGSESFSNSTDHSVTNFSLQMLELQRFEAVANLLVDVIESGPAAGEDRLKNIFDFFDLQRADLLGDSSASAWTRFPFPGVNDACMRSWTESGRLLQGWVLLYVEFDDSMGSCYPQSPTRSIVRAFLKRNHEFTDEFDSLAGAFGRGKGASPELLREMQAKVDTHKREIAFLNMAFNSSDLVEKVLEVFSDSNCHEACSAFHLDSLFKMIDGEFFAEMAQFLIDFAKKEGLTKYQTWRRLERILNQYGKKLYTAKKAAVGIEQHEPLFTYPGIHRRCRVQFNLQGIYSTYKNMYVNFTNKSSSCYPNEGKIKESGFPFWYLLIPVLFLVLVSYLCVSTLF